MMKRIPTDTVVRKSVTEEPAVMRCATSSDRATRSERKADSSAESAPPHSTASPFTNRAPS